MKIKKICVLGAGAMGHGIAQVCAQGGYEVSLRDLKEEFVQGGMERIRKFFQGSVERKKLAREEADAVVSRITGTTDLNEAAGDADLVIEAATENLDAKKKIFKELDSICPPRTIFVSNTSYLSIAVFASVTQRADRFAGTHWFNPPQIMRGVEVIKAPKTSQETLDAVVKVIRKIGKEPGIVKDSPGFVVNRLLMVFYNEGLRLYGERVAGARDIDAAPKADYGFRIGPLELRDFTGLDLGLIAHEEIYSETRREIFRPPDALIEKVRAGDLGRKTGRGFHDYS